VWQASSVKSLKTELQLPGQSGLKINKYAALLPPHATSFHAPRVSFSPPNSSANSAAPAHFSPGFLLGPSEPAALDPFCAHPKPGS
jgi:hypothetical protein